MAILDSLGPPLPLKRGGQIEGHNLTLKLWIDSETLYWQVMMVFQLVPLLEPNLPIDGPSNYVQTVRDREKLFTDIADCREVMEGLSAFSWRNSTKPWSQFVEYLVKFYQELFIFIHYRLVK